jgi:hypothetical protein
MQNVRFENNGVVQMMEIRRSKIEQLVTMGGRVSDLTLTGTKVQHVINDLGGTTGFQFIHF